MPNILPIVGVLLTALIGLGVSLYRNRLGYNVVTISGQPAKDREEVKVAEYLGPITAEELTIKSFGLRTLTDVELHLKMSTNPVATSVTFASSISKGSVKTEWADQLMKITVPTLPRDERITIDIIRVGYSDRYHDRLRGTGGKYKIVDLEKHERGITTKFIVALLILFAMHGLFDYFGISSVPIFPQQPTPPAKAQLPPKPAS